MLKKLDYYIIRKFLGTFVFAITLIIFIVIIFDLSEKIDRFIDNQASLRDIVLVYYVNFIPYFINLFSPLFTFITVVFFTSRLAFNTEIIAMLSSGVSFRRLLVPYLISAVLLALLSVYLSNVVIPPANEKRLAFEFEFVRQPDRIVGRNIHMQIRPGIFIYLESYSERTKTGYRFSLEEITDGTLTYKLFADQIRFNEAEGKWTIENYNERKIEGLHEELSFGRRLDTLLPFTPMDFTQTLKEMETMNFRELNAFIANERLKGSEIVRFYEVEKHRRIAFPFATIVLTLIGVALSSRKVRGGIGLHLGAGITISFSFILFMQVTTTFATNGNLHPMIAVWIPNIIFGVLGAYLLKVAPK
ncbi:MAG: LptF/LptG family permease [Bacteroidales bacterium]|nr:LptF/LptG family permease [Bacteroidales bacterium]